MGGVNVQDEGCDEVTTWMNSLHVSKREKREHLDSPLACKTCIPGGSFSSTALGAETSDEPATTDAVSALKRKGKAVTNEDDVPQTPGSLPAEDVLSTADEEDAANTGQDVTFQNDDDMDHDLTCIGGDYFAVFIKGCPITNVIFDNCVFRNVVIEGGMMMNTIWSNIYLDNVVISDCYYSDWRWHNGRLVEDKIENEVFEDDVDLQFEIPVEVSREAVEKDKMALLSGLDDHLRERKAEREWCEGPADEEEEDLHDSTTGRKSHRHRSTHDQRDRTVSDMDEFYAGYAEGFRPKDYDIYKSFRTKASRPPKREGSSES